MDAVTTTDEGNKIALLKSALVHMVFDCQLDRENRVDSAGVPRPRPASPAHRGDAFRRAAFRRHQTLNVL
jgi:hypothetical protein